MIRFRNPVSDIDIIINVFKSLYSEFSNMEYFTIDNIAEHLAREKLASSSGYTGDEAFKRSYRIKDDSRKSMRMQAKSYSELYRTLGWLNSKDNVSLNFTFTYLGVHVALSGPSSKKIFTECLLGITYPNNNLSVKFDDINKPFVSILKFAFKLGGKINRDEILLGPMNLLDGKDSKEIIKKINYIKNLRSTENIKNLNSSLEALSNELGMKPSSVRNLTRFVISSLVYSGWFTKENLKIYGKKSSFLVLTKKGEETYKRVKESLDVYGRDLNDMNNDFIKKLSNYSLLKMLQNADFDLQDELIKITNFEESNMKKLNKTNVLFSPFQYFSSTEILKYMPDKVLKTSEKNITTNLDIEVLEDIIYYEPNKTVSYLKVEKKASYTIENIINSYFNNNDINNSIEVFLKDVAIMKQGDFYPLIADMLSFIFDKKVTTPPAGNNNLRYDVIIEDSLYSIPVEVKSPTEEIMLSVKAIRQALENKVVLLSRKPFTSNYQVCSMAIGFNLPNKRADVYQLIDDIYNTFKINIAITDIRELTYATIYCYKNNTSFNILDFMDYRGRIKFNYEDL